MRKSRRPLIIVSRRSLLAKTQTQMVGRALVQRHPDLEVQYRWIESEGDQKADQPLAEVGGKGLFVKRLEEVLLRGEADLAVHSAKDMLAIDTPGLLIAATPARADVRDCLITHTSATSIDQLPQGATMGTSSPRRAAQAKRLRPDLNVVPLRGNVDTRLRKVLEEHQCDATLLAMAGLLRLGLTEHTQHPIDPSIMLPAACQGALALQCRADDHVTLRRCLPLNDPFSAAAMHAERQIVASLNGDCRSAIAVLFQRIVPPPDEVADLSRQDRGKPHYRLRTRVFSPDGSVQLQTDAHAPARHSGRLVKDAIKSLKEQGAAEVLKAE